MCAERAGRQDSAVACQDRAVGSRVTAATDRSCAERAARQDSAAACKDLAGRARSPARFSDSLQTSCGEMQSANSCRQVVCLASLSGSLQRSCGPSAHQQKIQWQAAEIKRQQAHQQASATTRVHTHLRLSTHHIHTTSTTDVGRVVVLLEQVLHVLHACVVREPAD